MDRPEIIRTLRQAHNEILNQRRQIEELAPKAHAYDTIARLAANTDRREGVNATRVDPAWEVEALVERLVAEQAPPPPGESDPIFD